MSDFYARTYRWATEQWVAFFYENQDWLLSGDPVQLWKSRLLNDTAIAYKGFVPIWVTEKNQYIPLPFMRHNHLRNAWKMCVNNMVQSGIDATDYPPAMLDEWSGDFEMQRIQEAEQNLLYWFKSSSYLQQEFCRRNGSFPALPDQLRAYVDKTLQSGNLTVVRGLQGTAQDLAYCNLTALIIHDIWHEAHGKANVKA